MSQDIFKLVQIFIYKNYPFLKSFLLYENNIISYFFLHQLCLSTNDFTNAHKIRNNFFFIFYFYLNLIGFIILLYTLMLMWIIKDKTLFWFKGEKYADEVNHPEHHAIETQHCASFLYNCFRFWFITLSNLFCIFKVFLGWGYLFIFHKIAGKFYIQLIIVNILWNT